MGGWASYTIRNKAGYGIKSWYGGFPVISYMTVHPNDHISVLAT